MRAVLQRVTRAEVRSEGELLGRVGPGMLVLLGVLRGDRAEEARALADKVALFRFFRDAEDKMNRSALDCGAEVLVVSQFTLAADGRKGRRPSFDRAAPPAEAEPLYELFVLELRARGLRVETGRFGARMEVELVNDGPVTFVLDEEPPTPV
ncbi:MAG: D-tyrosyl-tRNA(Tyr) deacylase [Planctomycetes bacterium]|nr:D-tyrosyl-tRNA(Tyr) deacylase [Planctomycetota bacterium]